MPIFECRFPDFDGDESRWRRFVSSSSATGCAAEEFCEDNFQSILSDRKPPFRVEVRDKDGNVRVFTVEVDFNPTFWSRPG